MTSVDSPINRDYVRYLQAKLVAAETGLLEMGQNYADAKARFDRACASQGITPQTDIVSYQKDKALHPELDYWYSKVEHFQREVAAYGAALTGIEASLRMLGPDDYRRQPADGKRGRRRDSGARRSESRAAATAPAAAGSATVPPAGDVNQGEHPAYAKYLIQNAGAQVD
jgi:hypothetical protein